MLGKLMSIKRLTTPSVLPMLENDITILQLTRSKGLELRVPLVIGTISPWSGILTTHFLLLDHGRQPIQSTRTGGI